MIERHKKSGFALVVALGLMAFVLLLILGLTTFTRVESANAASSTQLLRAREAAHLAVQVAVGDLQRYAGPDARVLATAGVLDDDPETTDATEGVSAGSEHWLGVWDAAVLPRHFNDPASPELADAAAKESAALRWLVSGESHLPRQPIPAPVALGEFSHASFNRPPAEGSEVRSEVLAPMVSIETSAGTAKDAFAFWIQDAGSAAALKTRQADGPSGGPTNDNSVLDTLVEKQLPRGFPLELMTPPFDSGASVDMLQERVFTTGQFALFGDFESMPVDLFPASSVVLSNPETGELKKDLSALLRGETPAWMNERLWADTEINTALIPSAPPAPQAAVLAEWPSDTSPGGAAPVRAGSFGPDGEVVRPPLHPVIARVQLFIQATPYEVPSGPPAAGESQVPPKIRLHVYPTVLLWNPYDVPIEAAEYGVEIDCKIDVQVTEIYVNGAGFPTLRGFDGFTDEGADTNQIFPQNIVRFYDDPNLLDEHPLIFRIDAVSLQPGECLVFSPAEYTDLELAAIRNRDWSQLNELTSEPPFRQFNSFQVDTAVELQTNRDPNRWHLMTPSTPGVARVYHRHATINGTKTSDTSLEARLFHLSGAGEPMLHEVTDLTWVEHKDNAGSKYGPAWNSAFYEINAPEPNLPQGKGHIFYAKPGQVQFQSADEAEAHGENIAPFSDARPWASRSGRTPSFADQRNLSWGGVIASESQNWFVPDTDTSDPDRLRGFTAAIYRLVDLPPASSGPGNHYLAAHQPDSPEDLISLGAFQHFALHSKNYFPAYAIGRPARAEGDYVDLANRAIWDAFYLTGSILPASAERPFANDRLELAPGADPSSADTAINLMQKGALNINSPYPRAWLATLAAQFEMEAETESADDLTGTTSNLNLAPDSTPFLHTLRPATGPEAEPRSANPASWRGYRQLSEGDTPELRQLSALAEAIAEKVRERGPFRSMADFVNSGALQDAIDSTSLEVERSAVAGINADFGATMRETPGFLSQANLLQVLAPALNYRSDTFRIRGYGETRDLNDRVQASVICEAVVQRLPEPHPDFGRRFRIVSFNYLPSPKP